MYALYTVVTAVLAVLASPYFLWKGRKTGKYVRTFRARMGWNGLPSCGEGTIWVHAVSVGEVLAARPLVERLKEELPSRKVVVSTTTLTGQGVALRSLTRADAIFYAPFDWPRPIRRVLDHVRPSLLVIMETELWPNLLHETRRRGVRVAIANGRISARSLRRYLRIRSFMARVLADVDLFLMQGDAHAVRIRQMGAPEARVRSVGNLKFDIKPRVKGAKELLELVGPSPAPLVAGSTLEGEEETVLGAYRSLREMFPGSRLVIAPRHPERFDRVFELVTARGFSCARRRTVEGRWAGTDVLLLDTLGELASMYAVATVVFVGGSLVAAGGHNVLEAAVHGKAVVVGPHMQNFQEIANALLDAGALVQIAEPDALGPALLDLLRNEERRREIGEAARQVVLRNGGAVDHTVSALAGLLR